MKCPWDHFQWHHVPSKFMYRCALIDTNMCLCAGGRQRAQETLCCCFLPTWLIPCRKCGSPYLVMVTPYTSSKSSVTQSYHCNAFERLPLVLLSVYLLWFGLSHEVFICRHHQYLAEHTSKMSQYLAEGISRMSAPSVLYRGYNRMSAPSTPCWGYLHNICTINTLLRVPPRCLHHQHLVQRTSRMSQYLAERTSRMSQYLAEGISRMSAPSVPCWGYLQDVCTINTSLRVPPGCLHHQHLVNLNVTSLQSSISQGQKFHKWK